MFLFKQNVHLNSDNGIFICIKQHDTQGSISKIGITPDFYSNFNNQQFHIFHKTHNLVEYDETIIELHSIEYILKT